MITSWEQQQLFEEVVAKLSYRPGYEITVVPFDPSNQYYHRGTTLQITKLDDDPRYWDSAETGQPLVKFGINEIVPLYIDNPQEALAYIRYTLRKFEESIMNRWLRIEGHLVREEEE